MKLGISLKIDVTKLDKSKFHKGKKGTYCDLTVFVDPNSTDQYGNHGGIHEKCGKDEPKNFVGNAKIFWTETTAQANNQPQRTNPPANRQQPPSDQDWDDD